MWWEEARVPRRKNAPGMCPLCWRAGGPWGWMDTNEQVGRRKLVKFCSRDHRERWIEFRRRIGAMKAEVQLEKIEADAIEASLGEVGAYVVRAGIGDKTFNDLSRDDVLGLMAKIVRAYRASLEQGPEHEIPY